MRGRNLRSHTPGDGEYTPGDLDVSLSLAIRCVKLRGCVTRKRNTTHAGDPACAPWTGIRTRGMRCCSAAGSARGRTRAASRAGLPRGPGAHAWRTAPSWTPGSRRGGARTSKARASSGVSGVGRGPRPPAWPRALRGGGAGAREFGLRGGTCLLRVCGRAPRSDRTSGGVGALRSIRHGRGSRISRWMGSATRHLGWMTSCAQCCFGTLTVSPFDSRFRCRV
jgi:hypothetical protein